MSNINKQFGKDLIINSTTDASGTSTGSIVSFGGANIDKKLFLGSSYSATQLGNSTGAFLTVNDNATFLDTTSTSTNNTAFWANFIGNTTIATTNASVTFGTGATLYIDAPPQAGTNVTLTNPWSIYLNTGGSYFGGPISINTTSVTQALSVNGNINFTGNLYQNGSVYSGSTQWGSTGANIYFNTGNVGIGTITPGTTLDVNGTGRFGSIYGTGLGIGTSSPAYTVDLIGTTRVSSGFLYLTSASGGNSVIQQTTATAGITISSVSGTAGGGSWIELYDSARFGGTLVLGHGGNALAIRDSTNITYASFTRTQVLLNAGPGISIQGSTAATNTVMPLGVFFNAESYNASGGSSLKNSFYNAGTLVTINGNQNITAGTSTAALIDMGAYIPGGSNTNVYLGCVSGTSANGPGNFVVGRRTGVSTWSETLRVSTSGNVGIGTTSPVGILDIRDPTNFIGDDGGALYITGDANGNRRLHMGYHNTGNYGWIESVEKGVNLQNLSIQARGGNVGIGTTGPAYKLDVNGTARLGTTSTVGSVVIGQNINSGLAISPGYIFNGSAFVTNGNAIAFDLPFTGLISFSDNIILNGGSLGIGTTSPSRTLDVNGDGRLNNALLTGNGTNAMYIANTSVASSLTTSFALYQGFSGDTVLNAASTAAGIQFKLNNTEYMRLSSAGNVGIGTTNPISRLHLANPSAQNTNNIVFEVANTVDGNNTGWSAINWNGYFNNAETRINTGKNRWRIAVDQRSTGDAMAIDTYNGTTLTTILFLTTSGNVGIGTASPSTALHVSGQILGTFAVHLSLYGTPTLYNSSGTVTAGTNTGIYLYPKFPSYNNQNWTPSYSNQTRLAIPYNGIYFIQFTYMGNGSGTRELFISKNLNNNNDLNINDDRLLCCLGSTNLTETSISATAYLTTSDFINFGFWSSAGDNSPGGRGTVQVTLIQRTA